MCFARWPCRLIAGKAQNKCLLLAEATVRVENTPTCFQILDRDPATSLCYGLSTIVAIFMSIQTASLTNLVLWRREFKLCIHFLKMNISTSAHTVCTWVADAKADVQKQLVYEAKPVHWASTTECQEFASVFAFLSG